MRFDSAWIDEHLPNLLLLIKLTQKEKKTLRDRMISFRNNDPERNRSFQLLVEINSEEELMPLIRVIEKSSKIVVEKLNPKLLVKAKNIGLSILKTYDLNSGFKDYVVELVFLADCLQIKKWKVVDLERKLPSGKHADVTIEIDGIVKNFDLMNKDFDPNKCSSAEELNKFLSQAVEKKRLQKGYSENSREEIAIILVIWCDIIKIQKLKNAIDEFSETIVDQNAYGPLVLAECHRLEDDFWEFRLVHLKGIKNLTTGST